VVVLMALNDQGENPAGTGPPDGIDDAGGADATVVAATVVDEAVAPNDTVEPATGGWGDPAVGFACLGEQAVMTSNNVTIDTGSERLMHS
jgi:hypothetical protein